MNLDEKHGSSNCLGRMRSILSIELCSICYKYELFMNLYKKHKKLRKIAVLLVYAVVDKTFFQCYIIAKM